MEEYQSIGKRIAMLRKERGMTQDQLAERVGVTAQAVSKWENDNSCPDISILPQIAEVLGVSTDELLGVKPIEPHVVVVGGRSGANGAGEGAQKTTGFPFHWDGDKRGGVCFAILIILLGVAFLLSRTGLWPFGEINFWGIVWPAVLLAFGISWTVSRVSPVSLGVALLGLYYLLFNLGAVQYELGWGVIWPIALILVGISLLLDKLWPNRGAHDCGGHRSGPGAQLDYSEEEGFIRFDCSFAETTQVVDTEEFRGGDIDASFGKFTVDLTRCKRFAPGARLHVDVSFGACEVVLPRSVRLVHEVSRSFGSAEVKGAPDANATEQLDIYGDTSFGSLIIRYY